MTSNYYIHPRRFPKNVEGPFYTLGQQDKDGTWCGECLSCEIPELEAPTLLAPLANGNGDTYFVRQPETQEEIEDACQAVKVCCVNALRYGGNDPKILAFLGPEFCDNAVPPVQRVVHSSSVRSWWKFWA